MEYLFKKFRATDFPPFSFCVVFFVAVIACYFAIPDVDTVVHNYMYHLQVVLGYI